MLSPLRSIRPVTAVSIEQQRREMRVAARADDYAPSSRLGLVSFPGFALQSYTSSASSSTTFINSSKPCEGQLNIRDRHVRRSATDNDEGLDTELVVVVQP